MPLLGSRGLLCVIARYKKCRPSGRKRGQRWLSCFDLSSTVTTRGVPPELGTWKRPLSNVGANRIVPSAFQVPPRPSGASHTTVADPPSAGTVLSLPPEKNPTA